MSNSNDSFAIDQLTKRAKALEAELAQARNFKGGRRGATNTRDWLIETEAPREEEEGWYTTYLDMMTLLLVLMIVMLAFSGHGEGKSELQGSMSGGSKSVSAKKGGDDLLHGATGLQEGDDTGGLSEDPERLADLGLDGLGDDIDVLFSGETISFRINSEILFPSGNADLSRAGLAVLARLGAVLKKNNYPIAVEGHTDSIPIRSLRYPSNWELSGARAGSVVRYFEANGVEKGRLRAVGFADTRPLSDNETAEGRANNRRVELTMDIPLGAKLEQPAQQ